MLERLDWGTEKLRGQRATFVRALGGLSLLLPRSGTKLTQQFFAEGIHTIENMRREFQRVDRIPIHTKQQLPRNRPSSIPF